MNIEYIRKEFCQMADLIERKNDGYDDAYAGSCDLFEDYGLSKIHEKYKRIYNLRKKKGLRGGKDLKDALRDEIGYCMLMLDRIHEDEEREAMEKKDKNFFQKAKDYISNVLRLDSDLEEEEDANM